MVNDNIPLNYGWVVQPKKFYLTSYGPFKCIKKNQPNKNRGKKN